MIPPPLVGRTKELEAIGSELRRAAAGELRCVLLTGDPGVGKTRLAAEFVERAGADVLGLTARAYPFGETASFGLWVEALEQHLRDLTADHVQALCGGFADDLAALLRSAAAASTRRPVSEQPRPRLLEGLAVLVHNLGNRQPLALVLDDFHHADPSSCEALAYLARTSRDVAILVVIAARPVELGERVVASDVLYSLEQEGQLRRLELAPLPDDELHALAAATLARPDVPASLVAWLATRSQGNPLYAIGLLRALVEEDADLAAPHLASLPEDLRQRVAERLRRLEEPELATLEVLAVLGYRVELRDLVLHRGRPLERLASILERLVAMRLVHERERGHVLTYEISHPLAQEAIYERIGAARRRALHRLVGRSLLAEGRLGAAAPHFARSADPGDGEAIAALLEALREAEARDSYREAFSVLRALLELIPPGDERWLDVLDAMSQTPEWAVDHRADTDAYTGIAALREIDRLLEGSSDHGRRGMVLFRLTSFLGWEAAEPEEAERVGRKAVGLLRRAGDKETARLAAVELSWVYATTRDFPAWEQLARTTLESAEAAEDRVAIMHALGSLGACLFASGRFADSEAALRRAIALAREDGKLYRLTWSLQVLAYVLNRTARVDEARAALAEGIRVNPGGYWDTIVLEVRTETELLAGRFAETIAAVGEALGHNPLGLSRRRAFALGYASMAATELGRLRDAEDFLVQAEKTYAGRTINYWHLTPPWARGLLTWRHGRAEDAVETLRYVAKELRARDIGLSSFALADLAEVAAAAGASAPAAEAAADARAVAEAVGTDAHRGLAAAASGWSSLAATERAAAAAHAAEAVELLAGSGLACYYARALTLLGLATPQSGRTRAIAAFEEAAAIFAQCGAEWRREPVLRELGRLGSRGRRAEASARGRDALSEREREVCELAARGQTAKEIGARLYIGKRTVETHLATAYAKLGVRSKRELQQRAAELGLARSVRGTEDVEAGPY